MLPVGVLVVTLLSAAGDVDAQAPVIDRVPVMEERRADDKRTRILAKLAVDEAAGETITEAQDTVLRELHGTSYQVLQRYLTSPYLALDVDSEALKVLARSKKVLQISSDFELQRSGPAIQR